MSYTKRFLVLSKQNKAMVPIEEGHETTDIKSAKSPSFLSADGAKGFAEFLTAKYPGKSFYLTEVLAGVKAGGDCCWGDAVEVNE